MDWTADELKRSVARGDEAIENVASGVDRVPIVFVNAYLAGAPGEPWVLVDSGLPRSAKRIRAAAEERHGAGTRPEAIVLTHGHFDHAGSALELARAWDVPIFAHPLELPFLTGRSDYPPGDPTIGGAISFMSRLFPTHGYDFADRVHALPADGSVPGLPGWRWLHTPGHTPGQVALLREGDDVLLAGDALTTMDLDSWVAQVTRAPELDRPPAPLTCDWEAAAESVERLSELEPTVIAAGHGVPIRVDAAESLRRLAAEFPVPKHGRYIHRPARTNEEGTVWVPPAPPDPLPARLAMGVVAAVGVAAAAAVRRRRSA